MTTGSGGRYGTGPGPAVADGHHRAPDRRGQALPLPVKDACSRRIVGYSIGDRMRSSLAVAALQMAVQRRNPVGTVVHSDRGSQFRSKRFVRAIEDAGLLGSMGRVGACADNAAMESFFALLPGSRRPTTGSEASAVWGS